MKSFKQVKITALVLMLLFSFVLMGASPAAEGLPFFEGYSAEDLYLLVIAAILGLSQGLWPEVSVFNKIKNTLNLEDEPAHYLVLLLNGILAAAALIVTGEIDFASMEFTLQNLLTVGGVIYAMSQIGYTRFKSKQSS